MHVTWKRLELNCSKHKTPTMLIFAISVGYPLTIKQSELMVCPKWKLTLTSYLKLTNKPLAGRQRFKVKQESIPGVMLLCFISNIPIWLAWEHYVEVHWCSPQKMEMSPDLIPSGQNKYKKPQKHYTRILLTTN